MTINIVVPAALHRWKDMMSAENRKRMFAAAADKMENLVRRHILRIAPAHHTSAEKLGATPTGHLTKGARLTVSHATENEAEVIIPIPGLNRALKPLVITPKNASALTIPIAAQSYGQRAARMRQLGWILFRPKGTNILMGAQKDQEPIPRYVLVKRVEQPQDRTILPSDAELSTTAGRAIIGTIDRIAKGAA